MTERAGVHAARSARGKIALNELPVEIMNLAAIAEDTPCTRTAAAIYLHIDERWGRRHLRPLEAAGERGGTWSAAAMRRHLSYAVRRHNLRLRPRVEHLHNAFTRIKSSGRELRLIIDCTDGGSMNAFNVRLPGHAPPPGMMRVPSVIAIVMGGSVVAVDDVRTAFAAMGMSAVMQSALGVGARGRGRQPDLICAHTRVPQGGTWSATLCQGATLTAALLPRDRPRSIVPAGLREHGVERDLMAGLPAADWFAELVRLNRLVHVDDVVSGGADARRLDEDRKEFRRWSETKYNVRWKDFQPSSHYGVALGIEIDCTHGSWGVARKWADDVVTSLDGWDAKCESDMQWAQGVIGWICQVLHIPKIIVALASGGSAEEKMTTLARTRARYVGERLTGEQRLVPWPRGLGTVQLSDASGWGWAGSALLDARSVCAGTWKRCLRADFSPEECCGGAEDIIAPSKWMGRAEAIASIMTFARCRHAGEVLILTDSQIWRDDVARSGSADPFLAGLTVLIWLMAQAQVATAHVRSEDNTMDAPSRQGGIATILSVVPPHTKPLWSLIGAVRKCKHTVVPLLASVAGSLPCVLLRMAQQCVQDAVEGGCDCEEWRPHSY